MRPSPRLCALMFLAVPVLHAHPGHGGHEVTWDLDHLVEHPVATAGCLAIMGGAAWLLARVATGVRGRLRRRR